MREEMEALLGRFSCDDCDDKLSPRELIELESLLSDYIEHVAEDGQEELTEELIKHVQGVVLARDAVREALAEVADEQTKLADELAQLIGNEAADQADDNQAELADDSDVAEEDDEDAAEEVVEIVVIEDEATTEEERELIVAAAVEQRPFDARVDLSKFQRPVHKPATIGAQEEDNKPIGSLVASGGARVGEQINTRQEAARVIHDVYTTTPNTPNKYTAIQGVLPVPAGTPMISESDAKNPDIVTLKLREATERYSLTADGSFCAPIQPDLQFCDLSDGVRNIVQNALPRVGAPRGRVQFMSSPKFDDFLTTLAAQAGTRFTETDSIAVDPNNDLTWKQCFQVDCPAQQAPAQLDAHYTCVYHKHFTTTAYPEYVEFFINNSLKVHSYSESIDLLNDILALPLTRTIPAYDVSATIGIRGFGALLAELNRRAYALRRAYWLPEDAILDVWFPEGVYDQIKQDFFLRACCDNMSVSDADIDAAFANIGLRVNFIANWQRVGPIGTLANTTGADLTVGAWNYGLTDNTFQFLMFIPGTLALLWEPRFNVGIVRSQDAALIRQNAFQLFQETFYGVVTPCDYQIQLHEITWCPAGETSGEATNNDPLFTGPTC